MYVLLLSYKTVLEALVKYNNYNFYIYVKWQIYIEHKTRNVFFTFLCKAFRDSNLKPQKTWPDSVKLQKDLSCYSFVCVHLCNMCGGYM